MRRFRGLSILMAVAMLTLLFAGMAFASTENTVNKQPAVDVDTDGVITTLGQLTILEPEDYTDTFNNGEQITITLPEGVDFDDSGVNAFVYSTQYGQAADINIAVAQRKNDQTLQITFQNVLDNRREKVIVYFPVELDGADEGDITAVVDDLDTGITPGSYVIGRLVDSDCSVTVTDTETIGEETGNLGTIKIAENAVNAMGINDGTSSHPGKYSVRLKLPSDMKWNQSPTNLGGAGTDDDIYNMEVTSLQAPYSFTGGLSGNVASFSATVDDEELVICFQLKNVNRSQRGALEIDTYVDTDDGDLGEIEVTVDGYSNNGYEDVDMDSTDVIIGTFGEWSVECYSDDTVETLVAGQLDQELATLKIDEDIAGSLLEGRKLDIEFPDYVRVTKLSKKGDASKLGALEYDDDYSTLAFEMGTASNGSGYEMEFDLRVSVAADAPAGDLVATITGSAGAKGEVVLGKIVKPITIDLTTKDIVLGDKDQSISDIVIKENVDEAIKEGMLEIELPEGVKFASTPKVEVTEGNLNIDEDDIDLEDGTTDDNILSIAIDSESSKASTITISNIELTADRTVPYGGIVAKFKGTALAENYTDIDDVGSAPYLTKDDYYEAGRFDVSTAAKVAVATLTTPAVSNDGAFFIGSTVYSQNGSMKVMDAAPYIKSDRTYVPVRFLAYMLGVTDEGVKYDEATKTVTITKGNDEVQLVIGSTSIMVNGEAKTMDVAPEITSDRTFLPARYVAEGLGYTVGWNPATQSVVIGK